MEEEDGVRRIPVPAKPNSGYVPLTLQRHSRGGIIKDVEEICSPMGAESLEVKMIDTTTGNPLVVLKEANAGPYIIVPVEMLEKVTSILDKENVSYWADEEAIKIDDNPEEVVINLDFGSDPNAIQGLLDSID